MLRIIILFYLLAVSCRTGNYNTFNTKHIYKQNIKHNKFVLDSFACKIDTIVQLKPNLDKYLDTIIKFINNDRTHFSYGVAPYIEIRCFHENSKNLLVVFSSNIYMQIDTTNLDSELKYFKDFKMSIKDNYQIVFRSNCNDLIEKEREYDSIHTGFFYIPINKKNRNTILHDIWVKVDSLEIVSNGNFKRVGGFYHPINTPLVRKDEEY
jgi:hypothetical protein